MRPSKQLQFQTIGARVVKLAGVVSVIKGAYPVLFQYGQSHPNKLSCYEKGLPQLVADIPLAF